MTFSILSKDILNARPILTIHSQAAAQECRKVYQV